MADRRLTIRIPIWVRVSGIIALVLAGVVVSSMLLGASGSGTGGHGGGDRGSQMDQMQGSGGHESRGISGDAADMNDGDMSGMDHNGSQTGPAMPSESELAESPEPCGDQTAPKEGGPSERPDDPTPTPGPGDHTRDGGSRGH